MTKKIKLSKEECKKIIVEYGDRVYDSYEIKFKSRIDNEWNCIVKGMYMYKGRVGFDIYYQFGNTDRDTRVEFDELFARFYWSPEKEEEIFKEVLSFKK